MSHFFGSVRGSSGKVTRCGTKKSGYVTEALTWDGGIITELYYDNEKKENYVKVWLVTYNGQGVDKCLYDGPISGSEFTNFDKE